MSTQMNIDRENTRGQTVTLESDGQMVYINKLLQEYTLPIFYRHWNQWQHTGSVERSAEIPIKKTNWNCFRGNTSKDGLLWLLLLWQDPIETRNKSSFSIQNFFFMYLQVHSPLHITFATMETLI